MDWVKLLTEAADGPKTLAAGNAGFGLYARALAYCGKYETDGFVPLAWVEQATQKEGQALAKHLLGVGLWFASENGTLGYVIPDFTEVNKSKAEMQKLRKTRSNAGRKGGKQKPSKGLSKSQAKTKQSKSKKLENKQKETLGGKSEFEDWLAHYRSTTGRTSVTGTQPARSAFTARREEGRSLEDLKLATLGSHSDDYCRQNGYDVPETILRASKVTRYIELGRKASEARDPLAHLLGDS